ncbi:MAG: hypothetical protein MZV70_63930 [Desulfobacterales bacterium]|nr:hypothetical protein [Desulfobacterales bacterium]
MSRDERLALDAALDRRRLSDPARRPHDRTDAGVSDHRVHLSGGGPIRRAGARFVIDFRPLAGCSTDGSGDGDEASARWRCSSSVSAHDLGEPHLKYYTVLGPGAGFLPGQLARSWLACPPCGWCR